MPLPDLRVFAGDGEAREDEPVSLNEQLFKASGDWGGLESSHKAQGLVLYRGKPGDGRSKGNRDFSTRLRLEYPIPCVSLRFHSISRRFDARQLSAGKSKLR